MQGGQALFVQARRANIRSEPGRGGRVIGTATKGSKVKVVGRSGKWVEVETDAGQGWINGGFFVIEPAFFELIQGDDSVLEQEPLEKAAAMG